MLVIIAVVIVLLILWGAASEFIHDQWLHGPQSAENEALFGKVVAEQAAAREFWLKVVQTVLYPLVPILTALLGYIFGNRSARAESADSE